MSSESIPLDEWPCTKFSVFGFEYRLQLEDSTLQLTATHNKTGRTWKATFAEQTFPWIHGTTLENKKAKDILNDVFTSDGVSIVTHKVKATYPTEAPQDPNRELIIAITVHLPYIAPQQVVLTLKPLKSWNELVECQFTDLQGKFTELQCKCANLESRLKELEAVQQPVQRQPQQPENQSLSTNVTLIDSSLVPPMPAESDAPFLILQGGVLHKSYLGWARWHKWVKVQPKESEVNESTYEITSVYFERDTVRVLKAGTYMIYAVVTIYRQTLMERCLELYINGVCQFKSTKTVQTSSGRRFILSEVISLDEDDQLRLAQGFPSGSAQMHKGHLFFIQKLE